MEKQPILETNRLILRPFNLSDAKRVQELAGDSRIAETTLHIPHPYEDGLATLWISTHKDNYENGKSINHAIVIKGTEELIGEISLVLKLIHRKAEVGYWIGVPYWGKGYCTEACKKIIEFGFERYNLNRIYALAMVTNIGSWRVMEKVGMKYEGTRRQDIIKNGVPVDLKSYSILREEYYNSLSKEE